MEAVRPLSSAAAVPPLRHQSLESLARLDVSALDALYRAAAEPPSVSALEGHPTGRMLAVRRLDRGAAAFGLRSLAGAGGFPWGGKSFAGRGATGTGINRVHLLGRHQLFPFLTRLGHSEIDGRGCVVLDYDLPDNPRLIASIHDEVREVEPGLFLGPAMWKGAAGRTLVLWFALDVTRQAQPIGRGRAPS